MKRQARRLLSCLQFANSLRSTRLLRTRSLHTQVTRFPHHLSPFLSTRSSHYDAFSVLRSQLKKQEEGITSEKARRTDSLTELPREQIANSFFSQSEAAGKNWFRPCSSNYRLKLKSCAIHNEMEGFWAVVENVRKKGIISMRRRFQLYTRNLLIWKGLMMLRS